MEKRNVMSERDIQAEVLRALAGDTRLRVWRANTGVAKSVDGSRFVRFGVSGQADLSGLVAGGRRLEVEVKAATGRLSPQQTAFGATIQNYGGIYLVVRSAAEALEGLNRESGAARCPTCGAEKNNRGV